MKNIQWRDEVNCYTNEKQSKLSTSNNLFHKRPSVRSPGISTTLDTRALISTHRTRADPNSCREQTRFDYIEMFYHRVYLYTDVAIPKGNEVYCDVTDTSPCQSIQWNCRVELQTTWKLYSRYLANSIYRIYPLQLSFYFAETVRATFHLVISHSINY